MTATASPSLAPRRRLAVGVASATAAVGAVIAVAVVALVARAAGAPWETTTHRARDPRRTLSRLVPAVLLLSFLPDVLLGVSGSAWSGVAALMVMHLAVAAVALPVYARLLALPARA